MAVLRDFSRCASRITRTSTPRLASAARSFSAVVSRSSYMVRSSDDLAPVMSLSIAPTPAEGSTSTRSAPDPPATAAGWAATARDVLAFAVGLVSDFDFEWALAFAVGPALIEMALHPARAITSSNPEATIANNRRMSPIRPSP